MKSINHYVFRECQYSHETTKNTWNIEYQHANISQMNLDHTSSTPPFCHQRSKGQLRIFILQKKCYSVQTWIDKNLSSQHHKNHKQ